MLYSVIHIIFRILEGRPKVLHAKLFLWIRVNTIFQFTCLHDEQVMLGIYYMYVYEVGLSDDYKRKETRNSHYQTKILICIFC